MRIIFQILTQTTWAALKRSGVSSDKVPKFPITDYDLALFFHQDVFTKIISSKKNLRPRATKRPDVANLAADWLSQELAIPVRWSSAKDLTFQAQTSARAFVATVLTPTRRDPLWVLHLIKTYWFARVLRKLDIPVLVFMPDTFDPETAMVANILTSKQGGATVFLQSTCDEASKFGYCNPVDGIFWTWPKTRLLPYEPQPSWEKRSRRVVLAQSSSDSARIKIMSACAQNLESLSGEWEARYDGGLSNESYIALLKSSKICITTNTLPPIFTVPWGSYRALISQLHTTGRVWEAFASGCLLICQTSMSMKKLGFVAGVHFVELGTKENPLINLLGLSDEELSTIAMNGSIQFKSRLSEKPIICF